MLAPPSFVQRSKELLIGRDLVRLARRAGSARTMARGDGGSVVTVAGFGAGDASMVPLRQVLRRLGHDVHPARLGTISDDVEVLYRRLADNAARLADARGRRVSLVGWSIGGVLAREAARDRPDVIDGVVTFGTPVVGGPAFTALAGRYRAERLAEIAELGEERDRSPITVPVTAIWSRNDGVVTPAACIDRLTPDVRNVEVSSTHLGMGVDPDVWDAVATALARTA